MDIIDDGQRLLRRFACRIALLSAASTARLGKHFQTVLRGVVTSSVKQIDPLPLLNQTEQHRLPVERNNRAADASRNKSIHKLSDDIVCDRIQAQSQDLTQKSYGNAITQLTPGFVIDWSWSAEKILALFRSLELGHDGNSIGLPKIYCSGWFYIITALDFIDQSSDRQPGTLVDITAEAIQIATSSRDVLVRSLQTLEGQTIDPDEWADELSLTAGARLGNVPTLLGQRITAVEANCLCREVFWMKRLAALEPLELPIAGQDVAQSRVQAPWQPPAALTRLAHSEDFPDATRQDLMLVATAAYLARICQSDRFDLGLAQHTSELLPGCFADVVPCRLNIDWQVTFPMLISQVKGQISPVLCRGTFHRDIVSRYLSLAPLCGKPIAAQFATTVVLPKTLMDYSPTATKTLDIVISEAGDCVWSYDTGCYATEQVDYLLNSLTAFVTQWSLETTRLLSTITLLSPTDVAASASG